MTPLDNLRRIVAGWRGEWRVDAHAGVTLSHDGDEWPIADMDGDAVIMLVELLNAIQPAVDGATAEIERLTAELVAEQDKRSDAIRERNEAEERARTVIDGRASQPATVGGLLAAEADALLCRWYAAKQDAIGALVDLENLRRPDPDDSWAGGIGRHDPMPGAEKRAADTKERLVDVTNKVIAAMTRGPIGEVPNAR